MTISRMVCDKGDAEGGADKRLPPERADGSGPIAGRGMGSCSLLESASG